MPQNFIPDFERVSSQKIRPD